MTSTTSGALVLGDRRAGERRRRDEPDHDRPPDPVDRGSSPHDPWPGLGASRAVLIRRTNFASTALIALGAVHAEYAGIRADKYQVRRATTTAGSVEKGVVLNASDPY